MRAELNFGVEPEQHRRLSEATSEHAQLRSDSVAGTSLAGGLHMEPPFGACF
jgi:hypothetical protein